MKNIWEILERVAPLEWYSFGPVPGSLNKINVPPVLVWRFKEPMTESQSLGESRLIELMSGFKGDVDWAIWKGGRNWVLTLRLAKEMEDSGTYRTYMDIDRAIGRDFPEISQTANREIQDLVAFLDERVPTGG